MIARQKFIARATFAVIGAAIAFIIGPNVAEANTEQVLYNFQGEPSGAQPNGGLIRDDEGNFYGTTYGGGTSNFGTIFQMKRGRVKTLFSFGNFTDNAQPTCKLIRDAAGNLYGSAGRTGVKSGVFKLTPQGAESVLHSFNGGGDGLGQVSDLVADAAGNLYGTTDGGGVRDSGTVFKLTPAGVETVLYSFRGGNDGGLPKNKDGMTLDAEGNLYGTTYMGGANNFGTIFKVTPSGQHTVLHSFGGLDGIRPYSGVVMDGAGNLYGTTQDGGSPDDGLVYQLTPEGTLNVLYTFTGGSDGGTSITGVILDRLGNLYGVTSSGGNSSLGTVYQITPEGTKTVLYNFLGFDAGDGSYPAAGLLMDGKGNLYGTTTSGGTTGNGTIFKVSNRVTN